MVSNRAESPAGGQPPQVVLFVVTCVALFGCKASEPTPKARADALAEAIHEMETTEVSKEAGGSVPRSTALGGSVVIDSIKVTFPDEPRLERVTFTRFLDPEISEEVFLVIPIEAENVSQGRIVTLQTTWQNTSITDNFGNVYSGDLYLIGLDDVEGVVNIELRPGERTDDLMIFPAPLPNATHFHLISDPDFYRGTQDGFIVPFSAESFQLEFSRNDITKSEVLSD